MLRQPVTADDVDAGLVMAFAIFGMAFDVTCFVVFKYCSAFQVCATVYSLVLPILLHQSHVAFFAVPTAINCCRPSCCINCVFAW